jgi:hypothetical protein
MVKQVTPYGMQLSELAGKEFFDAITRLDQMSAVIHLSREERMTSRASARRASDHAHEISLQCLEQAGVGSGRPVTAMQVLGFGLEVHA